MYLDIIVPVYNAPEEAAACLESVRATATGLYRVTAIDDASPDPKVAPMLAALAERWPELRVLRNAQNQGFVGTCNRGFAETAGDVVLLNADTVTTPGWLDRLRECLQADPAIGTATPFSNNATICSFPEFLADNPAPSPAEAAAIAAAFGAERPAYPEVPTAVGFCMVVRRQALVACGGFDPVFSPGYGEENDFCRRLAKAGWRNVACTNAYVVHLGGRSFSAATAALKAAHGRLLMERHPEYDALVAAFIEADPLAEIRWRVQQRLLRQPAQIVAEQTASLPWWRRWLPLKQGH